MASIHTASTSNALADIAVVDTILYASEDGKKLHTYSTENLEHIESQTPLSLGVDFIGKPIVTSTGLIVTGRTNGVWMDSGQSNVFEIPSFLESAVFEQMSERLIFSVSNEGVYWLEKGMSEPITCTPPDGLAFRAFGVFDSGALIVVTQKSRTFHLHLMNLEDCKGLISEKIDDVGFYELLTLPASGATVIRTTSRLLVLDKTLQVIQDLPDPGVTVWTAVMVTNSRGQEVEGIVASDGKGTISIYTQSSSGFISLTGRSSTIVPGQIEYFAWNSATNTLSMTARAGHFVAQDLPGVLAKLPLVVHTYNGTHEIRFATSDPAQTIHRFAGNSRALYAVTTEENVYVGLGNGSILRIDKEGKFETVIKDDASAGRINHSIQGLSASGEQLYISRKQSDDSYSVLELSGGIEKTVLKHSVHINYIAATRHGFYYRTAEGIFYYESNMKDSLPVVVDHHNSASGHKTIVVRPDGKWVVFGRKDGFEIHTTPVQSAASKCVVHPNEKAAGVIAAFSHDSKLLVLGTWEGQLSLWERSGDCWKKSRDFNAARGTMITTLSITRDKKRLISSRMQEPQRTQIWDIRTGEDLGGDFRTHARAVLDNGDRLILVRESDVAELDPSDANTINRLCSVAKNTISAGLTTDSANHICLTNMRNR